jgi:hypothetical protein
MVVVTKAEILVDKSCTRENGESKNFLANPTNLGYICFAVSVCQSGFFFMFNVVKCIISVFMNLVYVEY